MKEIYSDPKIEIIWLDTPYDIITKSLGDDDDPSWDEIIF